MKLSSLLFSLILAAALLGGCRSSEGQSTASDSDTAPSPTALSPMARAAADFLGSLDETQRKQATFAFDDKERFNWHFIPKDDRIGVRWGHLSDAQKEKATALLRTGLSEKGYTTARSIMQLELVLREVENRPADDEYRNPEKYFISIYGDPNTEAAWGWRFEGHHLSLNFSSVSNEISATPAFMGTNPAIVREGRAKGTEVLKAEQNLGRAFVHSLSPEQRKTAIIDETAYKDIVTLVDRRVNLKEYEGLQATEMTPEQREQLLQLVLVYIDKLEAHVAEKFLQRIRQSGLDQLYFAWAGGTEPGQKHYYRIHGPTLLIEYDNTQNNGNHIHTVLRDPTNDFGEDLLKQHYEASHK